MEADLYPFYSEFMLITVNIKIRTVVIFSPSLPLNPKGASLRAIAPFREEKGEGGKGSCNTMRY